MESSAAELSWREADEAKARKLPTRLQAHAPPCLQLDQITTMAVALAEPFAPSATIDSLTGRESTSVDDGDQGRRQDNVVAGDDTISPESGWQDADPSSLFDFFQSHCIIANQAQS
ncbi:hypothetical protein TorRG33x02_261120 [Trema orientale]|uniref:Uncharacterized protein n=1 Tax=Trema orientale TaxID=63057 RepID=A0A2P5D694_TREOI|nr:hypothetical protein TorRG33x02_261120 [Trema orientale]